MTRLADDDVGRNVLSCRADILGTARQVILQQSLYSTFVYLYMFSGLAVQQSTLLPNWYYSTQWTVLLPLCICTFFSEIISAPVYRVLSSWYYSKQWTVLLSLCISHLWQHPGDTGCLLQQARDRVVFSISVHFARIGSAAIYGNVLVMPDVCFKKQWTILIIPVYLYTLQGLAMQLFMATSW